jgi:hypothetical protein
MKKIILAVVVMTVFCINQINAQVHFGLKGGINFENFELKNANASTLNLKNSTGWQAGALLQVKIPGIGLGVQPELLYTVRNATVDGKSNSINYFEVPVNLRMGLNLLVVRPYLMAGPYFAYAVKLDGETFKDKIKIDKFDWGIGLGGGVEIWKFQLDARYAWGIQNVSSVKEFEMKNNRFTVSLGFLFYAIDDF